MRARSLWALAAIGYLAACGTNDGLVGQQPPLVQSVAIGEQGEGRFRLAATVNAPDSGVLRMHWDATGGSITVDNALETEWTLPPKAGAYPIRLTVEDALGGTGQALVVILHDPAGRSEVTPVTLASFKQGQLVSSQTQHAAYQRGVSTSAQPVATPPGGVAVGQMSLAQNGNGLLLNGTVQGAGNNPVTATWSAIDGAFEQAQGLQARWRPTQPSGLGAISLTVTDGANNQGQGVLRVLMEQGVPRDNRIDFVTVRNGVLGRQAFAAAPTPVGVPQAAATPSALPVPASAVAASPSPVASASPSPSASPTPTATPTAPYATATPSKSPSPSPTPSKTPSPSPTPSKTPSPSPSASS